MAKQQILWGYADVAGHCEISNAVARQWKVRGKLPEPDFVVSGSPAWWPATIQKWWDGNAGQA